MFALKLLPLTAFVERLVAGARGRLPPPWVTDAGGIRSEASSGLPPPWVKKDAGGILSAAYGGLSPLCKFALKVCAFAL